MKLLTSFDKALNPGPGQNVNSQIILPVGSKSTSNSDVYSTYVNFESALFSLSIFIGDFIVNWLNEKAKFKMFAVADLVKWVGRDGRPCKF